jgi:hypothetical protein
MVLGRFENYQHKLFSVFFRLKLDGYAASLITPPTFAAQNFRLAALKALINPEKKVRIRPTSAHLEYLAIVLGK